MSRQYELLFKKRNLSYGKSYIFSCKCWPTLIGSHHSYVFKFISVYESSLIYGSKLSSSGPGPGSGEVQEGQSQAKSSSENSKLKDLDLSITLFLVFTLHQPKLFFGSEGFQTSHHNITNSKELLNLNACFGPENLSPNTRQFIFYFC